MVLRFTEEEYQDWLREHPDRPASELASEKANSASIRYGIIAGRSALSESSFQQEVIKWLQSQGWLVHGERVARTKKGWVTPVQGTAGFPDLVAAHETMQRIAFIEVKVDTGKASPNQMKWLIALAKCPVETYILTPSEFENFKGKTKL